MPSTPSSCEPRLAKSPVIRMTHARCDRRTHASIVCPQRFSLGERHTSRGQRARGERFRGYGLPPGRHLAPWLRTASRVGGGRRYLLGMDVASPSASTSQPRTSSTRDGSARTSRKASKSAIVSMISPDWLLNTSMMAGL